MRRELEAVVDATCTFTPRLNTKATNKILFKSLSSSSTPGTSPARDSSPEWPPLATLPSGRHHNFFTLHLPWMCWIYVTNMYYAI